MKQAKGQGYFSGILAFAMSKPGVKYKIYTGTLVARAKILLGSTC